MAVWVWQDGEGTVRGVLKGEVQEIMPVLDILAGEKLHWEERRGLPFAATAYEGSSSGTPRVTLTLHRLLGIVKEAADGDLTISAQAP